jgi:protein tyrosine/serine phosphatase
MRHSFHFGAFVPCIVIFLFPVIAPPATLEQSSAAFSNAPANPSALAQKIALAGVPNAGKINDFLLRGAQPSNQGLAELNKLGVATGVNLRGWSHEVESERKQAESLGLRYVNIPVSGWSPPTNEQVAQFLALLRSSPGQKIFVHCKYGEDRSGVMTAAYRIAENNWTVEQAIQEMDFFGFHYRWHPSMLSFVRKFPVNYASDPAYAVLRNERLE